MNIPFIRNFTLSMFEWLFGSSSNQVDPYTEKVEDVMQEARVVKDFYNR